MPVAVRSSKGEIAMRASEVWTEQASMHALGFKPDADPLRWQLVARFDRPGMMPRETPHLAGTMEVWSVRTRVLGELPVRVGADLSIGANRTRILALQFNEGRLDRIYVEESDTAVRTREMWDSAWSGRVTRNARYADCYALVNRANNEATAATSWGTSTTLEMGSLAKRFRELGVGWREADRGAPTLVKLRFERDHAFGLPLEVNGVSTRAWDQLP